MDTSKPEANHACDVHYNVIPDLLRFVYLFFAIIIGYSNINDRLRFYDSCVNNIEFVFTLPVLNGKYESG